MRLLCTGSVGLVGSACVDLFKVKGWSVVGADSNMRSKFFGTKVQVDSDTLDVDIRNESVVENLLKSNKFDAIIHAAAQPSHDYATDHVLEDFDVNARATVILLEAARKYAPTAHVVYVSTDKVYGENMTRFVEEKETRYHSELPFDESLGLDFAGDRSLFGCSKVAGDLYAQQYAERFGMKIGIFRPGCITGRNHQGAEKHGFLAYLTKCIKEEKKYKIFGFKGKQVRDQIHALDLASAFWHFVHSTKSGEVYNIGGGMERSISVLEAGEALSKKIGKPFKYELHEARKGDRCWDVHDVSKIRSHFPEWNYKYSLDDILSDLV